VRFALVALICLSCLSACPPAPCTPSNCSGCCAADGVCTTGTIRVECGRGGEACVACSSKERCDDGVCVPSPPVDAGVDAGPPMCACLTTCCLPDGSCAPNNDPAACGPGATFCGACRSGERCELGQCTSGTCTGCFDPLGVCRRGDTDAACGMDAGVCVSCAIDQECRNQQCVFTRCDATNCRFGCCRADLSCETAPGVQACGLSGAPCVTCAMGESCVAGLCF
jgi:hypothetical protein